MTPDEIAAAVLDRRPELLEKWLNPKVRLQETGVTWWLQTKSGR